MAKRMSQSAAVSSIAKREGLSKQNAKKILAWANKTKNGKTTTGHGNRYKGKKKGG